MNTCTVCGETKPLSDFEPNPRMKKGVVNQCRKCKYKRRISNPVQKQRKREHQRKWKFKNNYGITVEQFELMRLIQGDLCAICKMPEQNGKTLSVDHDHVTGQARKLLCNRCNLLIGRVGENVEILENAIEYLNAMRELGYSTPTGEVPK